MKKAYREAMGYAFKLDSQNYKDIVHDAYVKWYIKTGDNLFEQHRGVITKTVKNIFFNSLSSSKWMYDGEIFSKEFLRILSDVVDEEDFSGKVYTPMVESPLVDIMVNDTMNHLAKILSERCNDVLKMMSEGFKQNEIAEALHLSPALINIEVKKIKNIVNKMNYTNPFNGSRVKVKRRISQSKWNKKTDIDDFEFEDINEEVALWVHKESGEGWLVEVDNPILSETYVKRLVDREK